jgi:hypothetical protein
MLWPESWREAMLHLTISMDEGVCAPSEISSPSEVLATVGCDAPALTPRGVDAIDCLKLFVIDTIDCLKRIRGVDAIDCLKLFGVDTIDCLKCLRGVNTIEFANRFATWFICWFAHQFLKSNQMIFLNLTSSNRAQACECIYITCRKKDCQQH